MIETENKLSEDGESIIVKNIMTFTLTKEQIIAQKNEIQARISEVQNNPALSEQKKLQRITSLNVQLNDTNAKLALFN